MRFISGNRVYNMEDYETFSEELLNSPFEGYIDCGLDFAQEEYPFSYFTAQKSNPNLVKEAVEDYTYYVKLVSRGFTIEDIKELMCYYDDISQLYEKFLLHNIKFVEGLRDGFERELMRNKKLRKIVSQNFTVEELESLLNEVGVVYVFGDNDMIIK